MNRKEFIDTLSTLLRTELPRDQVEENLRYYDNYIRQQGDEFNQQEEINRIGDPHLIAQTIIESYKMSDQYKYVNQASSSYSDTCNSDPKDYEADGKDENVFLAKVKRFCIIVGVTIALFFVLRFAFALFIRVGIPLIIIYMIIRLIEGKSN